MMKNCVTLVTVTLLLLWNIAARAAPVTVGVVTDGPGEQPGWSLELFKNELVVLTKGEFDIRFPVDKQLDGEWSAERINAALKQLQNDPAVDMVLALGYVSSQLAGLLEPLRKPTFAPLVIDADLLGLPRKGNSSGVRYLNYLSGEADFARDLASFRNVVDCKHPVVLIDQATYEALPDVMDRAREVAAQGGVSLQFVVQSAPDEDLAAKLPENTDAVVVTSLPRLSRAGMDQLISALNQKRLPSLSFMGSHLVEQGLLMAESPPPTTGVWPAATP